MNWIKMRDKLPELGVTVLLCEYEVYPRYYIGRLMYDDGYYFKTNDSTKVIWDNYEFWAEIIAPTKES